MPTTTTVPFTTPGSFSWTVPTGVNFITVTCKGAAGGPGGTYSGGSSGGGTGGKGGLATLTIPVTAGDIVYGNVGARGAQGTSGNAYWGTGGGGGGASDVRLGGSADANRICVAGGGGGGGGGSSYGIGGNGGGGGGLTGGSGTDGTGGSGYGGGKAGTGGTQTTDGTAGANGSGSGGTAGDDSGGGLGWHNGGGGGQGVGSIPHYGAGGGAGGGSSYLATTAPRGATSSGSTIVGGGADYTVDGSVTITYTTNTAPYPPTITSPTNNAYVDRTQPVTVSWGFLDPDAPDTQSKADLRWKPAGGPTWTTITGAATTASQYTFPAGTFTTEGQQIEVQAQTYDTASAASGWGPSSFFTTVTPPPGPPTITAPASGATVNSLASQPLTWAAVTGQTDYQARRVADNAGSPDVSTVYEDTGVVASTAMSAAFTNQSAHQVGAEHWQLRVRTNGTFWTDWSDLPVSMALNAPPKPTLALTMLADDAAVLVQISNPTPMPPFVATVSNRLTCTNPDGTVRLVADGIAPNATVTDMEPGAGVNDYRCIASSANGATTTSD